MQQVQNDLLLIVHHHQNRCQTKSCFSWKKIGVYTQCNIWVYTGSLAPADFSGAVSNLCAFSRNSPNIQLIWFWLLKWRNSFTHAFLVTNECCRFGSCEFLLDLKKCTSQGLGVVGCCYPTEYVIFAGLGGLGTLEIMNFLYFLG